MKVFISIDMEGITGVSSEEQTDREHPSYARAAELMRGDLDAVLDGCAAAGVAEVVVRDAHDSSTNLGVGGLPTSVSLVSGFEGPLAMMQGLDESFDAALFVGYHAKAGTAGAVLDHTYTGIVTRVWVGDLEYGETGMNAGIAGAFGVPVVFASGDDALVREASECVSGITAVSVKQGIARTSARLLPPQQTEPLLKQGVQRALTSPFPEPVILSSRSIRLEFAATRYCDAASMCPMTERIDGRTLVVRGSDYLAVHRGFLAALSLAGTAA